MYSSARRSWSVLGSGTAPATPTTWPGVVPQVTIGEIEATSTVISLSKVAPSSVFSSRHSSTAASQSAPWGAPGRPFRYSNVVSSGAIMPARPPPSMVMLQMVMRPSIESCSITGPANSITWPVPPPTPIWPIVARIRSLAVTPAGISSPSNVIRIDFGLRCASVWVASTCSTSLVPMPNASAPNAPWVAVCESPQTIVMPGWVTPSSGPITWTMPCSREPERVHGHAELLAVGLQRLDLLARELVLDLLGRRGAVGGHVVVGGGQRAVGPADLRGPRGGGSRTPAGW